MAGGRFWGKWAVPAALALAFVLAVPARARAGDFAAGLEDARRLCRAGQPEQAIGACLALAADRAPAERFEALTAAAYCAAHHLRDEARALELVERIGDRFLVRAARARVFNIAASRSVSLMDNQAVLDRLSAPVLDEFGAEDFTAWPEAMAAEAFALRGAAHYGAGNGAAAVADFARAFQLSRGYPKWQALQRLGDTFWQLMDDAILAEACYRKCMAAFGGGWPGLIARVNLGNLLIEAGRWDAALQVYAARPHPTGVWAVILQLGTVRVHRAAGDSDQAIAALEAARAIPGIAPYQRAEVEKTLAELRGNQ